MKYALALLAVPLLLVVVTITMKKETVTVKTNQHI